MTLLEKTLIAVASVIVALMVVLMNVEVFLRYAFNSSTNLSEEYSGYMFAAATVLAFVPALMRGRFLRISAVLSVMPFRVRAVAELLVGVISAGFCLVLTMQVWALFQSSLQFGSVSDQFSATPLAYPQAILAPALLALSLAMIVRASAVAKDLWHGRADLIAEEENVVD